VILRRVFIKSSLAACVAGQVSTDATRATAASSPADAATDTESKRRAFPHRAEVLSIEDLNHNIKRIRLKPTGPESFAFAAGQYVLLKPPVDYIADFNGRHGTSHKDVNRHYSFASSPGTQSQFDVIIKHYDAPPGKDVPPGVVSTYVHRHLSVGDVVTLSDPGGRLYAAHDSVRPILLVAGGVGVAPFVCLLNYWFERKVDEQQDIYLFLGVRSRQDLILHEQFTEWSETKPGFHYIPALSHPQETDAWEGKTGYINVVLDKHFTEPLDAEAYLAGPPIMIKFTRQVLAGKGIRGDRVHRDRIRVR
jgi:Na+-transporting NADH:ubiquinone oxidoreductase subunit F